MTLMEFPVPSALCPPVVSPAPWGRCPRELAQGLPAYRATATLVYLFARSVHKSGHEQVTVLHKFCNVAYYASYYQERTHGSLVSAAIIIIKYDNLRWRDVDVRRTSCTRHSTLLT